MTHLLHTFAVLGTLFACIIAVGTIGILLDNVFGDDTETFTITVRERVRS